LWRRRHVGAWGEVLGETTAAAPMLDRLFHRSATNGGNRHRSIVTAIRQRDLSSHLLLAGIATETG
jgi:hypothetical protein